MIDELALVHLLLGAVALISCLSVENKRTVRTMPRALWVAAILLVPVAGPVTWFLAGRPYPLTRKPGWRFTRGRADSRPSPAPDDDTDFLRSLDQTAGGNASGDSSPPDGEEQERDRKPDRDDPGQPE